MGILKARRPIGLLGRTSLALLAVGLAPLALLSFRLVGSSRDAMTTQVLRTHGVAARTTAARVEAFLAARRAVAAVAAADPALAGDPASPEAAATLSGLLRTDLGLLAAALRDTAGGELVRAQRADRAAVVDATLEARSTGEVAVVASGGASWLRLDVPLAAGPRSLSLVGGLAPLVEALRPVHLGDEAELVLLDRDGTLVVGAAEALATFPAELVATAVAGRVDGAGRFAAEDGSVLGAYSPVPGASWVVVSRQPAAVAEATALALRRRSASSVALAVALALAMTGVARSTVVIPLRELVRAQRRLAGPAVGTTPSGEISELRAGFAELERRLHDREALDEVFLGRYQVLAVVGSGAMGTVFRGWDPALERPVAIKTVRFDRSLGPERRELVARLRDEAVTVARFSHPNIVGLYDLQESPEMAFLAMEYVDGASLERHLQTQGRLPPREAVPIALGIARGLAAAHAREVVHHDVKPANVLLGRDGAVKVVDFGISGLVTSLAADPCAVFGTPGFVPPEALQGGGYGPRGDLFALGAALYRMLTGELPFAGRSVAEVLIRTVGDPVGPPGASAPGIPAELDALVLDLLEKDPTRRCPSADEAVRRLEALAVGLDTRWVPPRTFADADLELAPTARISRAQWIPAATAAGEGISRRATSNA